MTANIT